VTKSELIEKLAAEKKINHRTAETAVLEIFDSMAEALVHGDKVEIRGFGSFTIREYEEHMARNPKTGEHFEAAARKSPFFKVGKDLKDRIMESVE
jgi:integration host factor subunit beta